MYIKKKFLAYSIVILLILAASTSFYRFIVKNDYLVSYEGPCDLTFESCYIGCEDEACESEYYYTIIERNAAEIYSLCGKDITDCQAAKSCPDIDKACSVTFCSQNDEDSESCTTLPSNQNKI